MNKPYREVPIETMYYREYGMHRIESPAGYDYIASFPDWNETISALKEDIPYNGHVVTTDYATMQDWTEVPGNPAVIEQRIRQAIDTTRNTDAVLHLGTPTPQRDIKTGESYWHNSVLTIHRGTIKSIAHKTDLFDSERDSGMRVPEVDKRKVYMGSAALICSELLNYYFTESPLSRAQPRQIVALTNFAVPVDPDTHASGIERAGGRDNHFREGLEYPISNFVLHRLPSVERVIVSDRGQPDLPPFNAVIRRKS